MKSMLVRLAAALFLASILGISAAAGTSSDEGNAGAHQPRPRGSYAACASRDAHGRIARDPRARNQFKRTHPCPATGKSSGSCPGYVIDHVQPLKRGGADMPANMQWQTEGAAKKKDRSE